MRRSWRRAVVTAAATAGVVGSAAWWQATNASSPPVREDVPALVAQLRCGAGDQVFQQIREIAPEGDVLPASPEAAVGAVLASKYPNLDRAAIRRGAADDRRAQVRWADAGGTKAVFATRRVGDRWVVAAYAACNRTLLAGVPR
jgi:hypothetical protein